MGTQPVDTNAEPVYAGVVRSRHQDQRPHRDIGSHVDTEGTVRLIDVSPVDDRTGTVADLFSRLPGEEHLPGKQITVPAEDSRCPDQGRVVGIVPAGVHFPRAEALIRDAVFLSDGEAVDVGTQDNAALLSVPGLCAFNLGIDARHRDAPVRHADGIQLLLDARGGHVFLSRQFRMLMKPAAQRNDIIVVFLHLSVKNLFQFVHGLFPLLLFSDRKQAPLRAPVLFSFSKSDSLMRLRRQRPSAHPRSRTAWSTGSGEPSACRRWSRSHSPGS